MRYERLWNVLGRKARQSDKQTKQTTNHVSDL